MKSSSVKTDNIDAGQRKNSILDTKKIIQIKRYKEHKDEDGKW